MPLFGRFLEMKNFNFNLYFSTLKVKLVITGSDVLYVEVICEHLWLLKDKKLQSLHEGSSAYE